MCMSQIQETLLAFYSQRSVTAAWATRSPWSISIVFLNTGFLFIVAADVNILP